MSRAIDADALVLDADYDDGEYWAYSRTQIENAPTIEPERKRGRFVGTEFDGYADGNPVFYEWQCSECGCVFEDEEPTYNFCPNCGADMREGAKQDG